MAHPLARVGCAVAGLADVDSRFAKEKLAALRRKLGRGETVYLAGLGVSGHNSGVALVEASSRDGLRLIANDEEERFSGLKHYDGFPTLALECFRERLARRGLGPADIHAYLTSWNYAALASLQARLVSEHLPSSLALLRPSASPSSNFGHVLAALAAPRRLRHQFELERPLRLIGINHHDNHAAFSYAASPFAHDDAPTLVSVMDGFGDEGAISLYVGRAGQLRCLRKNRSVFDSPGIFYSILSSTQGGWTPLSSEGRYMGAAAWGDGDRLTNPYYRQLRELLHFASDGKIFINRRIANWVRHGERKPYSAALEAMIGKAIPRERMWNPDAVLRVEDVEHSPITRNRVDLAAATQLVFEDALFHVVENSIRATEADRLVLSGGTALNCLANMRLLEHFGSAWYRRNLGKATRLHLWVPPIPGDTGAAAGAAFHFAMSAGAAPGEPLEHAFYCGLAPSAGEIRYALHRTSEIKFLPLGNVHFDTRLEAVADFVAFVVARDGVVGIFQGPAETGPRALGHRSILANPCNARTLDNINRRVKFREPIRPLAPMATWEAARQFFVLPRGAGAADYSALNFMALTVNARRDAYARIPAVIHRDGTARVQIVRREHDPFCHAYLTSMGRHAGVEVSVNTSLNVGSPIVQTPEQALDALKKAKALSGLLLIAADGEAFLAWHGIESEAKDRGRQLLRWYGEWKDAYAGRLARNGVANNVHS